MLLCLSPYFSAFIHHLPLVSCLISKLWLKPKIRTFKMEKVTGMPIYSLLSKHLLISWYLIKSSFLIFPSSSSLWYWLYDVVFQTSLNIFSVWCLILISGFILWVKLVTQWKNDTLQVPYKWNVQCMCTLPNRRVHNVLFFIFSFFNWELKMELAMAPISP